VFAVVASVPIIPGAVEGGATTLEEKLARIDAICARVAAAHDEGVVHGDLHDGRIRAAPDGGVEVDLSPKSGPGLSLSPEQLRGGPADARSDVFATACIAYRLLTGRPPFEGESLHAVLYRVLHEEPPDPRQLDPSIPEALATWLRRGLAREPAERFADGGEMLEALRRMLTSGSDHRQWQVSEGSVRTAWSRETARQSQDRFAYVVALESLRQASADGLALLEGHVVELTALDVHDEYGGAILSEVLEYGSAPVAPPRRGRPRWISSKK
jgi:serine/threonine protein kinase